MYERIYNATIRYYNFSHSTSALFANRMLHIGIFIVNLWKFGLNGNRFAREA